MRHPYRVDILPLALAAALAATPVACSDDSSTGPSSLTGGDAGVADTAPPGDATAVVDASDASPAGDAAGDAGDTSPADASDATSPGDASLDAAPPVDAGAGCAVTAGEAPLTASAAGIPADGLVLWVRADHGIAKTAQNEVCAWADQSGAARSLTPASSRPVWQPASVGGQAAIHFASVGSDMITHDLLGIPATGARTFVAVAQLVSTTGRFHPIIQGQTGSSGTYLGIDSNTYQTAGRREGVYVTNNSYDTALATSSTPRVHVMTVTTLAVGTPVASAVDYRVNGATQTLSQVAGAGGTILDFSAADFTTVGAVSGTPTSPDFGDALVAEAIVYNRALSLTERAAVETALQARYGIH